MLRRLIRRASRFGRQTLGVHEPFLFEVVPAVAECLGDTFPELHQRIEHVQLLVRSEEEAFGKTLERGLTLFEGVAAKLAAAGERVLPGAQAYELYATYGFPRDLVELMARERDLSIDEEGWSVAEAAHREISRSEGKFRQLLSAEQLAGLPPTESSFHAEDDSAVALEAECVAHFPGQPEMLVLDQSPFYPEAGGQTGDVGSIAGEGFRFTVEDTQKMGEIVLHLGRSEGSFAPGQRVRAEVDARRRAAVRANHTGTHLMHAALRRVLGEHVTQQGSYVGPDRLRFDLSHPKAITSEQLAQIEADVNAQVLANHPVVTTIENPAQAKARGVMALFGEKYGERVRVVDVGGQSTELCGGTHVHRSGDIGPFVILSERAIQAGVRRIEAATHSAALEFLGAQRRALAGLALQLKVSPEDVPERVEALQKQLKDAKKREKQSAAGDVSTLFDQLKGQLEQRDGVRTAVLDLGCDAATLRELGDRLRSLGGDMAVALFGRDGDKLPFLVVCLGASLERGLKAGDLARVIAAEIGGGGGGRPEVAQGQGVRAERLPAAVEAVTTAVSAALEHG